MSESTGSDQAKKRKKYGHGGARRGAGRIYGTRDRERMFFEAVAAEKGVSPLEIILSAARQAYQAAFNDQGKIDALLLDLAVKWASYAAPYIHRRMPIGIEAAGGSLMIVNPEELARLPDRDLDLLLAMFERLGLRANGKANGSGNGLPALEHER